MFFNVSDGSISPPYPEVTLDNFSFPVDSHLAARLVVLWPPMAKVTIEMFCWSRAVRPSLPYEILVVLANFILFWLEGRKNFTAKSRHLTFSPFLAHKWCWNFLYMREHWYAVKYVPRIASINIVHSMCPHMHNYRNRCFEINIIYNDLKIWLWICLPLPSES